MTEQTIKYLTDISQAITLNESFTADVSGFEVYRSDPKTRSAVERQLEIIGEAANKLDKLESDVKLVHSSQMISLRNRLIHAYDSIDDAIVWAIIKRHIPMLNEEISPIISSF